MITMKRTTMLLLTVLCGCTTKEDVPGVPETFVVYCPFIAAAADTITDIGLYQYRTESGLTLTGETFYHNYPASCDARKIK